MSNQHVIQRLQESRVLFRSHCAKPEPKNLYDKQSWNMAGVHLILVESVLSVYRQAETIKPEDEEAFVFYALLTMGGLHHHHEEEEENYLPMLEPEFQSHIADEHHLFTEPLHEIENYLADILSLEWSKDAGNYVPAKNPKPKPAYDGRKINAAIETMADPMLTHLEHEIQYLEGDKLRACGLPLSKLERWAEYEKTILKKVDPWVMFPFIVGHTPPNSLFPPLPPGSRSILAPWIFSWKHRKSWKFMPPQEPLVL